MLLRKKEVYRNIFVTLSFHHFRHHIELTGVWILHQVSFHSEGHITLVSQRTDKKYSSGEREREPITCILLKRLSSACPPG